MIKVYISGPYSQGTVSWNVHKAIKEADALLSYRYFGMGDVLPIIPHLCYFWDIVCPHGYEWWIHYSMGLLIGCDAVIRLPGESLGADGEVRWAKEHGIPVFGSAAEFLHAYDRGEVHCLTS